MALYRMQMTVCVWIRAPWNLGWAELPWRFHFTGFAILSLEWMGTVLSCNENYFNHSALIIYSLRLMLSRPCTNIYCWSFPWNHIVSWLVSQMWDLGCLNLSLAALVLLLGESFFKHKFVDILVFRLVLISVASRSCNMIDLCNKNVSVDDKISFSIGPDKGTAMASIKFLFF